MKTVSFLISNLLSFSLFANNLVTSVPFELIGERIYLQVSMNGSRPLNFVYDTGAGATIIDSQLVSEVTLLGLKKRDVEVTGNGGSIDAQYYTQNVLSVGDLTLDKTTVVAVSLKNIRRKYYKGIDGVIGNDLTRSYVIEINYNDMEISFYQPKGYVYNGTGEKVEMDKKDNGRFFVNATMSLKNGKSVEGMFLVDCGAADNRIGYRSVKKHRIEPAEGEYYVSNLYGISQQLTQQKVMRTKALKIGPFQFDGFPILLKPDDGEKRKRIGGIGNNVLKRFNIVINYPEGYFFLEPNHLYDAHFKINCSGFELIRSENLQYFLVDNIISNAEQLNLALGDTLVSINSKAIGDMRISDVNYLLMESGETVSLEFNSGSKRSKLVLKEEI